MAHFCEKKSPKIDEMRWIYIRVFSIEKINKNNTHIIVVEKW